MDPPNFQLFDFSDGIGAGDPLPWEQLGRVIFYAMAYGGAVFGLTAVVFGRREL